jgi:hypothetical protein
MESGYAAMGDGEERGQRHGSFLDRIVRPSRRHGRKAGYDEENPMQMQSRARVSSFDQVRNM